MASEQQFYGIISLLLAAFALMVWFDGWSSGISGDPIEGMYDQSKKHQEGYNENQKWTLWLGMGFLGYGLIAVGGYLG